MVIGAAGGNYWVRVLDFAMLYVMLALGLNVVVGFAGLLDLGYIAFYAVGAYMAALLSSPHLTIAVRMDRASRARRTARAVPAHRAVRDGARGDLRRAARRTDAASARRLPRDRDLGLRGNRPDLHEQPRSSGQHHERSEGHHRHRSGDGRRLQPRRRRTTLFGLKFPSVYMYYYLFVLCALFVIWVCTRLQHSRIGRAWAAIREDEIAAKAMGINTRNVKLLAFAMGASFGGLSGAMFGAFQGFVSPESFTFWESIVVLACVVLGGMGHIPGVILGAVLLAVFPEFLRSTMGPLQNAIFGHQIVDTEVIRQLLYGLAMVLIMLYRSEGLWPAAKHEDKIAKIAKRSGKKPVRA